MAADQANDRAQERKGVGKRLVSLAIVAAATSLVGCSGLAPAASGDATVVDDFDGPAGSPPDPEYWGYDIGPSPVHIWERGSIQTYTDFPENVRLDGEGHLLIEAQKSDDNYTSARVVTRDKLAMGNGRISARIKMPIDQGIWPAFWLMGPEGQWPTNGEIDIIELPSKATQYHVTIHGPNPKYEKGSKETGRKAKDYEIGFNGPIADLSKDFHEYWVDRQPGKISVGIDDQTLGVFTPDLLPKNAEWLFNNPMYALLNVAVGGDWPGPPDGSTQFPATMVVDWFRYDPSE